jgi:peptidoglycan/LPS O-acetylase OafA/YrhL
LAENPSSGRLTELDALRGIAAAMVVVFHYTWRYPIEYPDAPTVALRFFWGQYGVDLFFAISGFVIFMTLDRTSRAADFIVSRFARLFPPYWAAIIITTLIVHATGETHLMRTAADVALNFSMLQSFLFRDMVDGVYWSLAVELAFYCCMLGLWRLRGLDKIETLLFAWVGLKFLWWLFPDLPFRIGMVLIVEYIPFFAIGLLAYRVRSGKRKWSQQIPVWLFGLAATVITQPEGATSNIVAMGIYLCVSAVFVAMVEGRLGLLNQRILLWLGAISYPLYLTHQFIGFSVLHYLGRIGVPPWTAVIATIAVMLGLAEALRKMVEQPSLLAIRKWWKLQSAAITAPVPAHGQDTLSG